MKNYLKKTFRPLIAVLLFSLFMSGQVFAQSFQKADIIRIDIPTTQVLPETQQTQVQKPQIQQPASVPQSFSCFFTEDKKPHYAGRFLSIRKSKTVVPGEIFQMQVYIQNNGNTPWFSSDSGCGNVPIVNLGTAYERDRKSPFFVQPSAQTNWLSPNRIKMDTKRVDPLQVASFTFLAQAPEISGLYREFYAPVVEARAWIEGEALFSTDIQVGQVQPITSPYLPYILKSTNLSKLDLNGQKNISVSLSTQTMWVKIGDTVVRTFRVSTGAYRTPTPRGNFSILSKQKVRIAAKKPHYIMPLFMMFKNGGYGIHALPSLGNDRGVYWREALNHIGSPRSHGCIRLLPDDAQFLFDFADVGTSMVVKN